MKHFVFLLILSVLGTLGHKAAAQIISNSMDDLPPEMELPLGNAEQLEPIDAGMLGDSGSVFGDHGEANLHVFDMNPALLESTGTWLRRGYWFTEADVVLLDRLWRNGDIPLVGETATGNSISIGGGKSGAEAAPRVKLGRFLFRDHKNRDHTLEFIAFGGGEWAQEGRLDADTSLVFLVNNGNTAFDGATSVQYTYDSRMNSFELNYNVKSRMKRDRMEMEPNGEWVRRANKSKSFSLIAGFRYVDVTEDFQMQAFAIPDPTDTSNTVDGSYTVIADNDLFGPQLGFTAGVDRARWSLSVLSKNGMYAAITDVDYNFSDDGGVITSGSGNNHLDNLAFVVEAALVGKVHLQPNLSLRMGLEALFVSSIAHAPDHVNFVPTKSEIITDNGSMHLGGSIGLEGYW